MRFLKKMRKNRKSKKMLWILIFLLLVVDILAFVYINNNKVEKKCNTNSTLCYTLNGEEQVNCLVYIAAINKNKSVCESNNTVIKNSCLILYGNLMNLSDENFNLEINKYCR